ncbi:MAG: hypothetical protein ABI790_16305, partial [Betaproteobacteria bacterium]
MIWLFRLFGKLPLTINHAVGAGLGRLAWLFSRRHRELTRDNIGTYAAHARRDEAGRLIDQAIREQGKGITELAIAWTAPVDRLYSLVKSCRGWEHVESAKAAHQAIIFVTPHLGCYDIAGRYLESR